MIMPPHYFAGHSLIESIQLYLVEFTRPSKLNLHTAVDLSSHVLSISPHTNKISKDRYTHATRVQERILFAQNEKIAVIRAQSDEFKT